MTRNALIIALFATVVPGCGNDPPIAIDASTIDAPKCTGTIGFLADCSTNSECMSCLCKPFGHLTYCTSTCTVPSDCPSPAMDCVGGFCKR